MLIYNILNNEIIEFLCQDILLQVNVLILQELVVIIFVVGYHMEYYLL